MNPDILGPSKELYALMDKIDKKLESIKSMSDETAVLQYLQNMMLSGNEMEKAFSTRVIDDYLYQRFLKLDIVYINKLNDKQVIQFIKHYLPFIKPETAANITMDKAGAIKLINSYVIHTY